MPNREGWGRAARITGSGVFGILGRNDDSSHTLAREEEFSAIAQGFEEFAELIGQLDQRSMEIIGRLEEEGLRREKENADLRARLTKISQSIDPNAIQDAIGSSATLREDIDRLSGWLEDQQAAIEKFDRDVRGELGHAEKERHGLQVSLQSLTARIKTLTDELSPEVVAAHAERITELETRAHTQEELLSESDRKYGEAREDAAAARVAAERSVADVTKIAHRLDSFEHEQVKAWGATRAVEDKLNDAITSVKQAEKRTADDLSKLTHRLDLFEQHETRTWEAIRAAEDDIAERLKEVRHTAEAVGNLSQRLDAAEERHAESLEPFRGTDKELRERIEHLERSLEHSSQDASAQQEAITRHGQQLEALGAQGVKGITEESVQTAIDAAREEESHRTQAGFIRLDGRIQKLSSDLEGMAKTISEMVREAREEDNKRLEAAMTNMDARIDNIHADVDGIREQLRRDQTENRQEFGAVQGELSGREELEESLLDLRYEEDVFALLAYARELSATMTTGEIRRHLLDNGFGQQIVDEALERFAAGKGAAGQ